MARIDPKVNVILSSTLGHINQLLKEQGVPDGMRPISRVISAINVGLQDRTPTYQDLLDQLDDVDRAYLTDRKVTCPVCNKEIKARSRKRIFCGGTCRQTYHRVKKLVAKQERNNG